MVRVYESAKNSGHWAERTMLGSPSLHPLFYLFIHSFIFYLKVGVYMHCHSLVNFHECVMKAKLRNTKHDAET